MKILVVDDEALLVKGIKFNLENECYMVETAYDGATAIDMAKSGGVDLIILDLMMPQVDGLTACMSIRDFSNVPIIKLPARKSSFRLHQAVSPYAVIICYFTVDSILFSFCYSW